MRTANWKCGLAAALMMIGLASNPAECAAEEKDSATTASAADEPQALLRMVFRDAERGTAITPEFLSVDGKTYFPLYREGGYADVKLDSGDHTVVIKAKGYKDMTAKETALLDDPPLNIILLDPASPVSQLKPENLTRHLKKDHGLVTGFVVDEDFSKPLANVDVTLTDTGDKAKTDDDGFFALTIPLPNPKPLPAELGGGTYDTKNLVIAKEGFGTQQHKNLLFQPMEPKYLQIRLKAGEDTEVIDETEHRGGLQKVLLANPQMGESSAHDHDTSASAAATTESATTN